MASNLASVKMDQTFDEPQAVLKQQHEQFLGIRVRRSYCFVGGEMPEIFTMRYRNSAPIYYPVVVDAFIHNNRFHTMRFAWCC